MTLTVTWNDVADLILAIWVGCFFGVIGWYIWGEKPFMEEEQDDVA